MVNKGLGSRIFDGFNYTFLFVFALITIIPFIYIVSVSFAEPEEVLRRGFILFPTTFSLEGYRYIFSTDTIVRSLFVTIGITRRVR